mgnify:CR=1 FL=1
MGELSEESGHAASAPSEARREEILERALKRMHMDDVRRRFVAHVAGVSSGVETENDAADDDGVDLF